MDCDEAEFFVLRRRLRMPIVGLDLNIGRVLLLVAGDFPIRGLSDIHSIVLKFYSFSASILDVEGVGRRIILFIPIITAFCLIASRIMLFYALA